MKRSILSLLLAVSVLFNVFFLVGFLKARADVESAEAPDAMATRVAEALKLDGSQAKVFKQLRSAMREDASVLREAIAVSRRDLQSELDRDEPDLERVRELVNQEVDHHRQHRLAGAERFNDFLGVLSREQCGMLARRLHGDRPGPDRRRPDPRRFDRDGDGTLDEQEKAALEEHLERIEQRWRERQQRRREMRARFDADGDGHLDETEHEAFREFMQSQPRRGRGWPRRGGEDGPRGDRPPGRPGPRGPRPDGDRAPAPPSESPPA